MVLWFIGSMVKRREHSAWRRAGKWGKVWNSSQESEFRSQKLTTKHPASLGSCAGHSAKITK